MAVVSAVPGILDIRQGYASGRLPTDEETAEYKRQQAIRLAAVKHPAAIAAERAESERLREAERRAANPDPRQALRDAHGRRGEALAEVRRLGELQQKAAQLVAQLEERQGELVDTLAARNAEAATALVAALAEGTDQLPLAAKNDAATSAVAAVRSKLRVALGARLQLDRDLEQARQHLAAAEQTVRGAVYALGVDHAVAEAKAIAELVAALNRKRVDLWGLSVALTSEARALGPATPGLPPAVSRAIGPAADHPSLDSAWGVRLARLRRDAEAALST
jgi:hypothetical protein